MTEKYISRSASVAARLLGDEMMIMSAADSTLFSLNGTATLIWQTADGRTPLSQTVRERICAEFDVDFDSAYRDAEQFVEMLVQHGILTVSDRPVEEHSFTGD